MFTSFLLYASQTESQTFKSLLFEHFVINKFYKIFDELHAITRTSLLNAQISQTEENFSLCFVNILNETGWKKE